MANSADRRIWLDDHSAADLASITDTHPGVEEGVITDRDVRPDTNVGDQPAMIADPAVRTDTTKWTDRDVLTYACARVDHRPGMYPGRNVHGSLEKLC